MLERIENVIQCDECNSHLSYEEDDIEVSWNWNHKFRAKYIKCPICGNDICIGRIKN